MSRYRSGRGDSGARDGNRKLAELSVRGSHFVVAPSWNRGMDRSRTRRFWEVVSFLIHPRGGQVAPASWLTRLAASSSQRRIGTKLRRRVSIPPRPPTDIHPPPPVPLLPEDPVRPLLTARMSSTTKSPMSVNARTSPRLTRSSGGMQQRWPARSGPAVLKSRIPATSPPRAASANADPPARDDGRPQPEASASSRSRTRLTSISGAPSGEYTTSATSPSSMKSMTDASCSCEASRVHVPTSMMSIRLRTQLRTSIPMGIRPP